MKRSIPAMTRSELSRFGQSGATMVILLGIVIIPMLYGGLLIWSNFDPTHRLEHVPAAIVNHDEPVTIEVSGREQVVPLGRELTATLTTSEATNNFDWTLTDSADATAGLADGTYRAVLTIPENFSAAATSTSSDDGTTAHKATLDFASNDANLFLTGVITENISTSVQQTLNEQLTSTYLDNVFLGFNTVHDSLGQATAGAGELRDGANQLADGAGQAAEGSAALVVGLGDLASGADALASGANALRSGSTDLADGIGKINSGASDLARGADALATGASDVDDGAQRLAAGVDLLRTKTTGLPDAIGELSSMIDGALDAVGGRAGLQDGLTAATRATSDLADASENLASQVGTYTDSIDQLAATCANSGASEQFCSELTQLAGTSDTLKAGHERIETTTRDVATRTAALADGVTTAATDFETLAAHAARFRDQAPQLLASLDELMDGVDAVAAGTAQVAGGAGDLASGSHELNQGTADALAGATRLRDGLTSLGSHSQTLAAGAADAERGGETLASGTSQLASGSADVAGGAEELTGSLRAGTDQVPTYSGAERTNLADVVSAPVNAEVTRANAVASYGYGLGPYFMALALWVGAMALYMIVRAIPARAIASTAPTWRIAMAGLGTGWILGAVQAVGLILVLRYVVGLQAANLLGSLLFAILVSMTFMAINQSLIALLGTKGRFVALVLIVLQLSSAGATYPIETTPAFFQALSNWLPMTHAVNGFRTLTAGGGQGIALECAWLLAWLVGAFLVTVAAARKQRSWTIGRLHPELVI